MADPLTPATSGQGLCFQLGPDHTFHRASPEPQTGPKESLRVLLLQPPPRDEKSTAGSPGRDSQHQSCPQEPNETGREPVGTCWPLWKRTSVPSEHLQQLGCGVEMEEPLCRELQSPKRLATAREQGWKVLEPSMHSPRHSVTQRLGQSDKAHGCMRDRVQRRSPKERKKVLIPATYGKEGSEAAQA